MMATSSNETGEKVLSPTDCATLVPLCTQLCKAFTSYMSCKDAFLNEFAKKLNGKTGLVKEAVSQLRDCLMNLPQNEQMKTFLTSHQLLSADEKAQKDKKYNKQWEKFRKKKARLVPISVNEIQTYVEEYNSPASSPSTAPATTPSPAAATPLSLHTAAPAPSPAATSAAPPSLHTAAATLATLALNTAGSTPAPDVTVSVLSGSATAGSNANVAGTSPGTTSSTKSNRSKSVDEAYVYIVVWAPWREDFKFGRSQSQPKELLRLHGRCNGPAVLFWRVQLTSGSATGSDSNAVESNVLNNARSHKLRTDNNEDTTAAREIIKCGEGYKNVLKMFDFAMSKLLSLDTSLLCSDLFFYTIILQAI